MIVLLALATSVLLTFLLATAGIARAGLRGGYVLLGMGFLIGLLIGPLERVLNLQDEQIFVLIEPIALQFVAIGSARSMVYGLAIAVAITLALSLTAKSRRRGDIWNVAVGIGCGLGLSTTLITLVDSHSGWPPFVLVTAIANMPFQLCFALVVSASLLRSRFHSATQGLPPLAIYAGAIVLGAIYQAILAATLDIGHWLAWMEPTLMGWVWLVLIALFWFMGLAVMASQRLAAIPEGHHPATGAKKPPLIMRPGLWKIAALLVIAPAIGLFLATWWWSVDTALGRVMIYTLLSTPLLAGSVILRTAVALEDKPFEFRLR